MNWHGFCRTWWVKKPRFLLQILLTMSALAACGQVARDRLDLNRLSGSDSTPRVISNPSPALLDALQDMERETLDIRSPLPESSDAADSTSSSLAFEVQKLSPSDVEQLNQEQQKLSLSGEFYRLEYRSLDTFGNTQSEVVYVPSRFDPTKDVLPDVRELENFLKNRSSKDPNVSFSVGTNNMFRTERLNEIMRDRNRGIDWGSYTDSDDEVADLLEQMEQDRGVGIAFMLKVKF